LTHTVLDCAMHFSRLGLAVLPLHYPVQHQHGTACSCGRAICNSPAKHPVGQLVPSGLKNASTKDKVIEQWFRDQPWNLAIATGKQSGVFALDVDPRHGGGKSLGVLENKHGPLPPTWRFLTGGGGEHILFRYPGGLVPNSAGKIGVGIDVRGEAGYIVAPPSRHTSGRSYSVSVGHHPDDVPLADPPGWLIAAMNPGLVVGASTKEWRSRIGSPIPEGQRNDTLARISGHLLAHGIDPHVCLEIIVSLNATHCAPPLPEEEILNLVASITNRELAKRATRRREFNRG
jgi:hypothetical protein